MTAAVAPIVLAAVMVFRGVVANNAAAAGHCRRICMFRLTGG